MLLPRLCRYPRRDDIVLVAYVLLLAVYKGKGLSSRHGTVRIAEVAITSSRTIPLNFGPNLAKIRSYRFFGKYKKNRFVITLRGLRRASHPWFYFFIVFFQATSSCGRLCLFLCHRVCNTTGKRLQLSSRESIGNVSWITQLGAGRGWLCLPSFS